MRSGCITNVVRPIESVLWMWNPSSTGYMHDEGVAFFSASSVGQTSAVSHSEQAKRTRRRAMTIHRRTHRRM